MLLRGDPGRAAAEDLATPGVFAEYGYRVGAAGGQVDALPDRDAAACGGEADSAADDGVAERGEVDAGGQDSADEGLLCSGKVCGD